MLIHLVRKDFLIVKKYVLLMLAVCVFIPPFMMWRINDATYVGSMSFILAAIFSVFMLLQYVSLKENQYAKASTLLCATPYPRKLLVLSKYVFGLLIYGACCLIFWTETLLFPVLGGFRIELSAIMFLVVALFLGIYLPVQYKLGYETTKFAFFIIIMAFSENAGWRKLVSLNCSIAKHLVCRSYFDWSYCIGGVCWNIG